MDVPGLLALLHRGGRSLRTIGQRASFTVFIATGLEERWRMRAMYLAALRGQPHEQGASAGCWLIPNECVASSR